MDQALQELLDENEIKKVHLRYCRAIDRRDFDLLKSCYHEDAIDDHGSGEYVGGLDGFIEYCITGTMNFVSTTHLTGNQLVEVKGDTAWAEHYGRAYHRVANPDGTLKDLVCNTRWVDRFERRNGEWKIAKRVIVVDSERVDPVDEGWTDPAQLRGARDKTDPSYER